MHPRWWLDGPTWVPAEWESGVGLTSDELNPPPLDNSILHTKLINDGQLLLEKTAIEQESFRRQLGPEDAQRFAHIQESLATEAMETFETVIPPGSQITFPPRPKTRVRQAKTHGKAKGRGMTAAEIATKESKQRKKRTTQKQKRAQKPRGPQKHQQNRDSLDYTEVEQAEDNQEMLDCIVVRKC
jgi:hypothetical protein